jgi:Fic family protein
MKRPVAPPDLQTIANRLAGQGGDRLLHVVLASIGPAPSGQYRHWDTLRHLTPPEGFSADEWWFAIKAARRKAYQTLPLRSTQQVSFVYALPGAALAMVHRVDTDAAGSIAAPGEVTNPQTRDTYLFKSLVEESITSSQLEGASTTRKVAKEMLQTGRAPRNRSEQMILNNYEAMQFIRRFRREPLTPGIVLELQRILTAGTLDDPSAAGRLRTADEIIHVEDETGTTLHIPPKAADLTGRMHAMCAFANNRDDGEFVHPVIRAIMLHFWLAYDHPFVDGNGRTARAVFYWSMASQGYWLCEFLSISRILKNARARYSRSFLYTETDEYDATYFILSQLRVLIQAIDDLHAYLQRRTARVRDTEEVIASPALRARLNHRQLSLLTRALRRDDTIYTIESHRRSHNVSYATSRGDLLRLNALGLLEQSKRGHAFAFIAPPDLRRRLSKLVRPAGKRGTARRG